MICPFCSSGDTNEVSFDEVMVVNRQHVSLHGLRASECALCGSRFVTEAQSDHNFEKRSKERDRITLMTPQMIKELRTSFNLTQREAASLFGGGASSFSKYEAGDVVPTEAAASLMRIVREHPDVLRTLARLKEIELPNVEMLREDLNESGDAAMAPDGRSGNSEYNAATSVTSGSSGRLLRLVHSEYSRSYAESANDVIPIPTRNAA